jgi:hypothetical protein
MCIVIKQANLSASAVWNVQGSFAIELEMASPFGGIQGVEETAHDVFIIKDRLTWAIRCKQF